MNRYILIPVTILGDILVLIAALFVGLTVRSLTFPKADFFGAHAEPFIIILVLSIIIFFISGLYELSSIAHVRSLTKKIGYAQVANGFTAIMFFYVVTLWGITPKTTLVLYLFFSTVLLFIWRAGIVPLLVGTLPKESAILIAEKQEGAELTAMLSQETPYPLAIEETLFISEETTTDEIKTFLTKHSKQGTVIIADTRHKQIVGAMNLLYEHVGNGGEVKSFTDVYEEVFSKIPASSLQSENIITYIYGKNKGYDTVKRIMDIGIALPLFVVSVLVYPFVYLAIKLEDNGPIFFTHDRMGKGGKRISIYKFRSMTFGDTSATWVKTEGNTNKVTQVGKVIRKTRIDELPQLWNVLRGNISLVGPRPDVWSLGIKSQEEIPFYKARLAVLPGLSGWAQTQMHTPPQNIEETKERLLHDIYYVKNRSLALDLLIALKTVRTLLSREG